MRKQRFEWSFVVLGLVLTIYGGYSLIYNYVNDKDIPGLGIAFLIVGVADVYDALTSKRSYKDAWDSKEAYDEIIKNSGTQFDKTVVKAFTDAYDKIDEIRVKFADTPAVPPANA